MPTIKADWRDLFAEENNRIRGRIGTSPFEEIGAALRDLGRKLTATLDDQESRSEVHRYVAKWILYAAIEMKRPFEECESLLEQVLWLGFRRPQDRVTTVAVFARHCLLSGRKNDGYRYFLPAMTELENAPTVIAEAPPELVEGYRRLLAQLAPSDDQP